MASEWMGGRPWGREPSCWGEAPDSSRAVCLGPDALLTTGGPAAFRPHFTGEPEGPEGNDWLLELQELEGETVRVLIAGGTGGGEL
jgi:hypothetical protein